MKKQITLIVAMCLFVFMGNVQAQYMYIMKNGTVVKKQSIQPADLDSIVYTEPAHAVTTTAVTAIGTTTATSGGNITAYSGANVTARGVCWGTTTMPTIDLSPKTSDGTGTGLFTSALTGLSGSTKYYVRAYATNGSGVTSYGAEVSFTLGIETALIPAGTFTMGSPISEVNRSTNETQHEVTLSSYRMSKYEITNAQYAAFLNAKSIGSSGSYATTSYGTQTLIYANSSWGLTYSSSKWVPVVGYETFPVINVTWYGATEFATYVGGTLPTEAQWEYACRAGTITPFNTGNFLTNGQANYNWLYPYNGGTNTVTTYPVKPQAVGVNYTANAYGLYDMHGNVWEWCADWYGTYPTTAQTNPTGAATGSYRLIRGGSWGNEAQACRSAFRGPNSPYGSDSYVGFRVVFVP